MIDVIIVDDERLIRQGIAKGVNWSRIKCRVVALGENGQEGLSLIREHKPCLVITDIRMPLLSGLDMIQRAREFSPETDYIVLSGYDDFDYARKAISFGVLDYLLKPVDEEELESKIEGYVVRKKKCCSSCGNHLVDRIIEHVEYNLNDRQLTLAWLCENLFYKNADYMGRLFKKHMGMSFHSYLNQKRINRACELLKEEMGRRKIYEISEACGFPPDGQYFSTLFKSMTGMTPREYADNGDPDQLRPVNPESDTLYS